MERVMLMMRERATFPDRKIEPLDVRRKRQAEEGAVAIKEYRAAQLAVFERMVALRRERLAQLANGQK
jgi:hypothetical protein